MPEHDLETLDTKNERMLAGAFGGYVLGGPAGALAGAYIGRNLD